MKLTTTELRNATEGFKKYIFDLKLQVFNGKATIVEELSLKGKTYWYRVNDYIVATPVLQSNEIIQKFDSVLIAVTDQGILVK